MAELKSVPAAMVAPHRANLELIRAELKSQFYEREEIVDGILAALLSRHHVLLLGSPGTAKSMLAETVCGAISGAKYFSWLLTKFTLPEELFGMGFPDLQARKLVRNTTDKMPEAHFVFADEIFKASSSILNALLKILNERVFFNDGPVKVPLYMMIGASNEMPEGAELEAMFDRFMVRFWVSSITDPQNILAMWKASEPVIKSTISLQELDLCIAEASKVVIPDAVDSALLVLKQRLESQGFFATDRRWKQLRSTLRAYAYLDGYDDVNEDHLSFLADVLWREPKDRPQLATIIGTVGNPLNVRAVEIEDAAKEAVAGLGSLQNPKDAGAKAEWLKQSSLTETKLSDMEKELIEMVTNNPKRNLTKVKKAQRKVNDLRKALVKKVSEAYGL